MNEKQRAALERVVALADSRAQEMLDFAGEFIRQPSINPELEPNPDAERPAQQWLAEQLDSSAAFDTVDVWEVEPNRTNIVATQKGKGGGKSLIWVSHTDVVPVNAEQRAAWDGDPFSARCATASCYGRGSADMKGASTAAGVGANAVEGSGRRARRRSADRPHLR